MKILEIINSLNMGGAERLISFMLPELRKHTDVTIELLLLREGDSDLYSELINNGIKITSINTTNIYNPINTLKIAGHIRKGNYDIVHAHLFPTQYWVSLAKLILPKSFKLIFTEHNTSNRRINSKYMSIIDRQMYRLLDHLVCITDEIYDTYSAYQPALKSRISVINNGIPLRLVRDAKPINPAEIAPNISKQDILILQVSGFRIQKDQQTLIKALQFLPESFKVIFAGTGQTEKECRELTTSLNLESRVIFLGVRNDVYNLQKSVDYIVLSTHYEGLSLACIEGMASGKPFLASDVKGVKNLVEGAGILFEESNPEDLATLIKILEQDSSYREKTIEACIRRASQYSLEAMAQRHYELFNRISQE